MILTTLALSFLFVAQENKPENEHEWLKQFEGTWEASMTAINQEGKEEVETGSETATMKHGGLWLQMDFKGGPADKPFFTGSGMMGYNTKTKKFQMAWVDSMETRLQISEGALDKEGKAVILDTEMDLGGTMTKARWKWELIDKETKKFSISTRQGEKDVPMMWVVYKRKK